MFEGTSVNNLVGADRLRGRNTAIGGLLVVATVAFGLASADGSTLPRAQAAPTSAIIVAADIPPQILMSGSGCQQGILMSGSTPDSA